MEGTYRLEPLTMQTTLKKGVFFDLDGTLIDTAQDFHTSLNLLLHEMGGSRVPFETIRAVVSEGSLGIVKTAFRDVKDATVLEQYRIRFLKIYEKHLSNESTLFPGIDSLLDLLEANKIPMGIITNKPYYLTIPLLDALNLTHRFASVVGGDTLAVAKPHPAPILHACREAGCSPIDSIYCGDAERDIVAGKRAGLHTIGVTYGYIGPSDRPATWGANVLLDSTEALLEYIRGWL